MSDTSSVDRRPSIESAPVDPREPRSPRLGQRWEIVGMGALGAAIVTVIGLAAGAGSPVANAPRIVGRPSGVVPSADPRDARPPRPLESDPTLILIVRIFIALCLIALVVTALVLAYRLIFGLGRGRILRRALEPDELDMLLTPLAPGIGVPDVIAVQETLDRTHTALAEGADVRAAIIGAWLRLEDVASNAGTPHRETDTPTDLVRRLLVQQHVSARSLERLADLYRRARYSPADLLEVDRAAAISALNDIRTELHPMAQPVPVTLRPQSPGASRWT